MTCLCLTASRQTENRPPGRSPPGSCTFPVLLHRMKYPFLIGFLLCFGQHLRAQDEVQNQQVQKEFLILCFGCQYAGALPYACSAAKQLQLRPDMWRLRPQVNLWLRDSGKECEIFFSYHSFEPSRDYCADSASLSVKQRSAFSVFRSGAYIPIAASCLKGDPILLPMLHRAHKAFPEACMKVSSA